MPNLPKAKVDVKAALAKAVPNGLIAIGDPMKERLRPGLVWRGAFVDTFDGPIPDIVQAFLLAIYERDLSRKWSDSAEYPVEDRYAWARAILETGATRDEIYQGGSFTGRGDLIKVESKWLKLGGRTVFHLEVDHPDGTQVSIGKDGRLLETRGREIVFLQWLWVKEAKPAGWYPTHLAALVQCKGIKDAIPSFGYDLTGSRSCFDVVKESLLESPSQHTEIWTRILTGGTLAGRPVAFFPKGFRDQNPQETFRQDVDWLLAPYFGIHLPTSREWASIGSAVKGAKAFVPTRIAKKHSLPPNPLATDDKVVISYSSKGIMDETGLTLVAPEKGDRHPTRMAAIRARNHAMNYFLEGTVEVAIKNVLAQMNVIQVKDLPKFPELGRAPLMFPPDKAPGDASTVGRAKPVAAPASPGVGKKLRAVSLEREEPVNKPVFVPEPPLSLQPLPLAEVAVLPSDGTKSLDPASLAKEIGARALQAVQELREYVVAGNEAIQAKEHELRDALSSLEVAQARCVEVQAENHQAARHKEAQANLVTGLEAEVARLQQQVEDLLAKAASAPLAEPGSNLIVIEDDDSVITLAGRAPVTNSVVDELGAELVPSYYARLTVAKPMEAVQEAYKRWLLGFNEYSRAREGRLDNGVDADWGLSDLHGERVDLHGADDAQISIRQGGKQAIIRFRHRDKKLEGTTWTNLARVEDLGNGQVGIEHGVVRSSEEGAIRPGYTPVPGIVRDLLKEAAPGKPWDAFPPLSQPYNEANLPGLVNQLVDPNRDVPVVVVSRRRGELLVDPHRMARDWVGLATVHHEETLNSRALTQALQDVGVGAEGLGCWDGAVRVYYPGFNPLSDFHGHPLFTKTQISGWTPFETSKRIARGFALRSVPARAPKGFFWRVEQFDVEAAQVKADALVGTVGAERLEALEAQVLALKEALAQAEAEAEANSSLRRELNRSVQFQEEFESENQILQDENRRVRGELAAAQAQVGILKQAVGTAATDATSDMVPEAILRGFLFENFGPVGAIVRLIEARYPGRIEFLPTAIKGADKSDYVRPVEVLDLLTLLVTDYWEGRVAGGEDPAARVFGDSYAGHEGASLTTKGRNQRTFEVGGKSMLMEPHLKLTHGFSRTSDRNVFRIHFLWLGEEQKLVVGHCGKHLVL